MRRRGSSKTTSHAAFSLGRGAVFYVALLIFSVIFTQALRSTVSVVLLWFVCILPVVSLIYAVIGRSNVGAFVLSDEATAEKLCPVEYEFRLSNYSVLPLPFTEADIFLPSENGVSCESRLIGMSMLPFGEYYFKSDVTFRYRGGYRLGVGCIYVSDMLRIFRLRRKVNVYTMIYVMPRRIPFFRDDTRSASDAPTDSRVTDGTESSETSLIREYRSGDPLKHIHWKLSSKMQDLEVNDYKPNTGKNICVLCDFATLFGGDETKNTKKRGGPKKKEKKKPRVVKVRFPNAPAKGDAPDELLSRLSEQASDRAQAALAVAKSRQQVTSSENEKTEDAASPEHEIENEKDRFVRANEIRRECVFDHDEFCADGVSELAVGVVMSEVERGNRVTLMWFDDRADGGYFGYSVNTLADLDIFFRQFGTAGILPSEYKVTYLPMLLDDTDSPTLVFVTASAGLEREFDFITASRGVGAQRTEVILFDPKERFTKPELHGEYVDICKRRYEENKILLTAVGPSWTSDVI